MWFEVGASNISCLKSLVIRKMEVNTTMRYNHKSTMSQIKETDNLSVGTDALRLESSYIIGENVKCYNHPGKPFDSLV